MALKTNVLYYGDNLDILRHYMPDESVDLIYLDPPFNSNRSYNVLFKEQTGTSSQAQIEAFEDTWNWAGAAATYDEIQAKGPNKVARSLRAMVDSIGHNDVTAYLTMMAIRLAELHRVLKSTGSLYLHCDPTASHYLKVLMDSVFGPTNFRDEIVWQRTNARSTGGRWPRVHDTILYYTKAGAFHFEAQRTLADPEKMPHTLITKADALKYQTFELTAPGAPEQGESIKPWRGISPPSGRHWANNNTIMDDWDAQGLIHWPAKGGFPRRIDNVPFSHELRIVTIGDVWTDVDRLNQTAKERLGYPTQKPLLLLERILNASSRPGDVILDPFCGCGTAVHAAHALGRQWIGIDITHLAINVMRRRMQDAFPGLEIEVIGEPKDVEGARALADQDKYQFQWWALDRIDAQPVAGKKKGSDRGIDGVIPFWAGGSEEFLRALVSVKGGGIGPDMIRDLKGVLEREGEPIGIFLTLRPPTKEMLTEAATAGFYHSDTWGKDCARIQILTIAEVLSGKKPDLPPRYRAPYAQAPVERERVVQPRLGD